MHSSEVVVVGAGVVGLSIAHDLARSGRSVTVVHDDPHPFDCSPLAGAVWFPYGVSLDPRVLQWSHRTRERLTELATDPTTGVALRTGTFVLRTTDPDLSWTEGLAVTDVPADRLPAGAVRGLRLALPVIDMTRYLPWLRREAEDLGVRFNRRRLTDLADLEAEIVILAAGLRSAALVDDPTPPFPVRGQVVRLQNAGLTEWLIDDDHPAGMTYVIPRFDDIVVGGTADRHDEDTDPNPRTEQDMLVRARGVMPELVGLPVVSRGVGLRPGRETVRVDTIQHQGTAVITCYGHGGAGVSLSWGCAGAVTGLVDGL